MKRTTRFRSIERFSFFFFLFKYPQTDTPFWKKNRDLMMVFFLLPPYKEVSMGSLSFFLSFFLSSSLVMHNCRRCNRRRRAAKFEPGCRNRTTTSTCPVRTRGRKEKERVKEGWLAAAAAAAAPFYVFI